MVQCVYVGGEVKSIQADMRSYNLLEYLPPKLFSVAVQYISPSKIISVAVPKCNGTTGYQCFYVY